MCSYIGGCSWTSLLGEQEISLPGPNVQTLPAMYIPFLSSLLWIHPSSLWVLPSSSAAFDSERDEVLRAEVTTQSSPVCQEALQWTPTPMTSEAPLLSISVLGRTNS